MSPDHRVAAFAARLDHLLGRLVDAAGALLVLAEVVVLLAGVVSRYVLRAPLIWSDELASILFLWLAVLGAVIALRRGEHMRMTTLAGKAGPRVRAHLEVAASLAGGLFLGLMLGPAIGYAREEIWITTPALEIANAWRAAALPVGVALMLAIVLLRLAQVPDRRMVARMLLATLVTVAALWLLAAPLRGLGNLNLVIFFVGLVGTGVLSGVPIAFSFGLATFAYLALTTRVPLTVVVGRMDEGMSHLILLAVPLFVLLGGLIEMTGMARAMVRFLASLLGHVRGGLSYVLVGTIYLVSGISGSKAADMAAVAPVLFPEMKARGTPPGELVALLAATAAMSETIPPSLVLITIGSVADVSIAALFTGGLLPGVVLALMLAAVIWRRSRGDDTAVADKADAREVRRSLVVALPALLLPFLIRGAVVGGIATATEVSTIGIVYAVLAGLLIYRRFDWRRVFPMLVETASLSGAILLIIGAATSMAWALTQSGFSRGLAAAMAGLPGGAASFLAVSMVAFIVLGSVLEGIPALVLFGPLLFPIARQLGIHEVHYAMVVILAMGIGLFAPPFGIGFYTAAAIGRVPPDEGLRPIIGYVLALVAGLAVVAAVPWISIGFL